MIQLPPNNLPVVSNDYQPLGDLKSSEKQLKHTSSTHTNSNESDFGFRWGSFSLTEGDIAEFKNILEEDFGKPLVWSDDEIELMIYNLIYAFGTMARITASIKYK